MIIGREKEQRELLELLDKEISELLYTYIHQLFIPPYSIMSSFLDVARLQEIL